MVDVKQVGIVLYFTGIVWGTIGGIVSGIMGALVGFGVLRGDNVGIYFLLVWPITLPIGLLVGLYAYNNERRRTRKMEENMLSTGVYQSFGPPQAEE